MTQEKVTEILDVIDDVLKQNGLNLVLVEDLEEYEESKEQGNDTSIYGTIYYALESALKQIPDKESHYSELLNNVVEREGVALDIDMQLESLFNIGFTEQELIEDFYFDKKDVRRVHAQWLKEQDDILAVYDDASKLLELY